MSFSIIPLEIDGIIIDLLAEDDTNYAAVKACSLVCRALLPLCRKHIFASIVLNMPFYPTRTRSSTTSNLERLLSTSPEIADYIRKLDYGIIVRDFTSSFIQCLTRITRLQSLAVRREYRGQFEWSNNHLRPALLHLLHLPTLIHFKITEIDKFVASDLVPCVNLKTLEIGCYTTLTPTNTFSATLPNCSIRLNEFISGVGCAKAIMNICAAQRSDGQPVIDFSSLAKIRVEIQHKDNGVEASEELFGRCKQLTDVCISLRNPRWIRPAISNMLRPSMQTLRYLCISTHIDDIGIDPLASIPEFEHMRNKNILENIIIRVLFLSTRYSREDGDWGRLDEVLTGSGWSALRRVTLIIELSRGDEFENALRNLLKTQFPRLSTSKSVSFEVKVTALIE